MKKLFYLLILLCCVSHAQSFEQELDSLLIRHFPESKPGGAVMVVRQGKMIYNKGFGLANVKTAEKITSQTNFRMASVSKQFTAMCIMLLEKQHKLSYEDKLIKFFPDFNSITGKSITVRHLLTHTSGIRDYEDLIPDTQKEQVRDEEVARLLANQTETYFKPGTQFRYSNSGFCLLEQIVEKVSGKSYVAFVSENIFKPVGMKNSFIYEVNSTMPDRAMGYAPDKEGNITFSDQSITSATKGDGCVYTSPDDYYKWYKALLDNKLVNLWAELKKVNTKLASGGLYGLGWFHAYNANGKPELYHTGSTCGFSNAVTIVPAQKLLILYFSNLADNHAIEIPIRNILKKYKIDTSGIDFVKMLEMTR